MDIALQATAPGTVADLAQRGLGVAILSESMATAHSARLKALVIEDIETLAVLALIWPSTQSPALERAAAPTPFHVWRSGWRPESGDRDDAPPATPHFGK